MSAGAYSLAVPRLPAEERSHLPPNVVAALEAPLVVEVLESPVPQLPPPGRDRARPKGPPPYPPGSAMNPLLAERRSDFDQPRHADDGRVIIREELQPAAAPCRVDPLLLERAHRSFKNHKVGDLDLLATEVAKTSGPNGYYARILITAGLRLVLIVEAADGPARVFISPSWHVIKVACEREPFWPVAQVVLDAAKKYVPRTW